MEWEVIWGAFYRSERGAIELGLIFEKEILARDSMWISGQAEIQLLSRLFA